MRFIMNIIEPSSQFTPIFPAQNNIRNEEGQQQPQEKTKSKSKAHKLLGDDPNSPIQVVADKVETTTHTSLPATPSLQATPKSLVESIKKKFEYFVSAAYAPIGGPALPTSIPLIAPQTSLFLTIKQAAARCLFYLAGLIINKLTNDREIQPATGGRVDGGSELVILPALGIYKSLVKDPVTKELKDNPRYGLAKNALNMFADQKCLDANIKLKTQDQIEIDSSIVWANPVVKGKHKESKWIVRYLAQGDCYENYLNSEEVARYRKEGFNVLLFNYRGVMDSKGYPKDVQHDLLADGNSPVSFLKEKGVDPKNITLVGESLGGGIATEVAALNPGVRLANLRSFASLTAFVQGQIHDYFGRGALATFTAYVVSRIAGGILSTLGWEINSAKAWEKIPLKDKWMVTASQDNIIKSKGKLFHVVTQKSEKIFRNLPKGKNPNRAHARALAQRKFHAIKAHGADHNIPLTDASQQKAFEEHIRFLHHTPNEIFEIFKDNNPELLPTKIALLTDLPADSPLFEDPEFYDAADKIAKQAMINKVSEALKIKLRRHNERMRNEMGHIVP